MPARRDEVMGELRRFVGHQSCPLCDTPGEWDDTGIVVGPLVRPDGSFDLESPFTGNDLYTAAVFTCRICHFAVMLTLGGDDQPNRP
jgi:hypothetical protein